MTFNVISCTDDTSGEPDRSVRHHKSPAQPGGIPFAATVAACASYRRCWVLVQYVPFAPRNGIMVLCLSLSLGLEFLTKLGLERL